MDVTTLSLAQRFTKDYVQEQIKKLPQSGFFPTVEIVPIEGGHKVIITDINGKHKFDVLDGKKGDKGDKGDAFTYEDFTEEQLADLKGNDYVLTEADKVHIAKITLGLIPIYNGEVESI